MKLDPGIHIAMHSVLSLKPGVTDDVGFEHLFVLPHIQYNGTDKPITFLDLIIDVQS